MSTPSGSRLPTDPAELTALVHRLSDGTLADRMGMEWLEVGAERTVARIPVAGNTQPMGLLHGGASAALAETIGSFAALLAAGDGRVSLGVELNCTHHRSVREGYVTGTATPLSVSRSVATYAISITDDSGALICTARLTCLLRDAR